MIPAYKYNLKIKATDKWPDIYSLIINALEKYNCSSDISHFHLEESGYSSETATHRILKKNPTFSTHLSIKPEIRNVNPAYKIISSFLSTKQITASLQSSLKTCCPLIGRSLPFNKSVFLFQDIPWHSKTINIEITESHIFSQQIPRNCVIISNNWWISGRKISVSVIIFPTIKGDRLVIPKSAESFINTLGKVKNRDFIIFPEEGEKQKKFFLESDQSSEITLRFQKITQSLHDSGALELDIGNTDKERETGFSRKKIINDAINELGYRSANSTNRKGLLHFTKQTSRNNSLILMFDFGSASLHCNAWLIIQGPLWMYHWPFPIKVNTQGFISNSTEFKKVIYNVKEQLIAANSLINDIQQRHEISPKWYLSSSQGQGIRVVDF